MGNFTDNIYFMYLNIILNSSLSWNGKGFIFLKGGVCGAGGGRREHTTIDW